MHVFKVSDFVTILCGLKTSINELLVLAKMSCQKSSENREHSKIKASEREKKQGILTSNNKKTY